MVPSTHRLELDAVQRLVDRSMSLATEGEIADLFGDCELGAVPPVGPAYGLNVLMDESLADQSEVFFEGGDHRSLVRVNGADFDTLMGEAQRGLLRIRVTTLCQRRIDGPDVLGAIEGQRRRGERHQYRSGEKRTSSPIST